MNAQEQRLAIDWFKLQLGPNAKNSELGIGWPEYIERCMNVIDLLNLTNPIKNPAVEELKLGIFAYGVRAVYAYVPSAIKNDQLLHRALSLCTAIGKSQLETQLAFSQGNNLYIALSKSHAADIESLTEAEQNIFCCLIFGLDGLTNQKVVGAILDVRKPQVERLHKAYEGLRVLASIQIKKA